MQAQVLMRNFKAKPRRCGRVSGRVTWSGQDDVSRSSTLELQLFEVVHCTGGWHLHLRCTFGIASSIRK